MSDENCIIDLGNNGTAKLLRNEDSIRIDFKESRQGDYDVLVRSHRPTRGEVEVEARDGSGFTLNRAEGSTPAELSFTWNIVAPGGSLSRPPTPESRSLLPYCPPDPE